MAAIYHILETSPEAGQVKQLNRVVQSMYVDGLLQAKKIEDTDLQTYRDKQQEIILSYIEVIRRMLANPTLQLEEEVSLNVKLLCYSVIQSIQSQ